MQVKVVAPNGDKKFLWWKKGKERLDEDLASDDFYMFSAFTLIRDGQEFDRGWVSDPRGDRFCFAGLEKIRAADSSDMMCGLTGPKSWNFLTLPAKLFETNDILAFGN